MDHQHIKKLGEIVTKQNDERQAFRDKELKRTERQRGIDQAPTPWETEFFCAACDKDFKRMAHKVVQTWTEPPIAFYEAKCPSNLHWCRRRITDKIFDPYYSHSKLLRRAKVELERDLIQPGDPRFNRIYGDPYRKHHEELEKKEREAWQSKRDNP